MLSAPAALAAGGYIPLTNVYKADRPVYDGSYNVNDGLYPVLNYKPDGAAYPYLYIPLAMFRKLGMTVTFDDKTNIAKVTDGREKTISDQQAAINTLKEQVTLKDAEIGQSNDRIRALQAEFGRYRAASEFNEIVVYQGMVDGYMKFSGGYWYARAADSFTEGRGYRAMSDGGMGQSYLTVINNLSEQVTFQKSSYMLVPICVKYVGKTTDGLYGFSDEAGTGIKKYQIVDSSDTGVSFTEGRVYVTITGINENGQRTMISLNSNGVGVTLKEVS